MYVIVQYEDINNIDRVKVAYISFVCLNWEKISQKISKEIF